MPYTRNKYLLLLFGTSVSKDQSSLCGFHHMPWIDASSRPQQKPLLLSRALTVSLFVNIAFMMLFTPPAWNGFLPPSVRLSLLLTSWMKPLLTRPAHTGYRESCWVCFDSSAARHVHQALFPVRSLACTWQGGTSIWVNCSVPAEFVRMRHNSLSKGGHNHSWHMYVSKKYDEVHGLLPGAPDLVNIPEFVGRGSGTQRAHQRHSEDSQMHIAPFSSVLDGPHAGAWKLDV